MKSKNVVLNLICNLLASSGSFSSVRNACTAAVSGETNFGEDYKKTAELLYSMLPKGSREALEAQPSKPLDLFVGENEPSEAELEQTILEVSNPKAQLALIEPKKLLAVCKMALRLRWACK